MTNNLKIANIQINSTTNINDNINKIIIAIKKLPRDCQLAILPENCLVSGALTTIPEKSKTLEQWQQTIIPILKYSPCPIIFGGIPEKKEKYIYNTTIVIDNTTQKTICTYHKIHLFQLHNPNCKIDETTIYTAGQNPISFYINQWKIGLTTCYDLRFPELFRKYLPADLIICTAAFTKKTGIHHWTALLKARAIENQCYIAGVNQCGKIPKSHYCYGHTATIDPWGIIINQAGNKEQTIINQLTKQRIKQVRNKIPALLNICNK